MKKLLTNVQTLDNSQIWFIEKSEPGPDLKLFEARFDFIKNPRNGITEKKYKSVLFNDFGSRNNSSLLLINDTISFNTNLKTEDLNELI